MQFQVPQYVDLEDKLAFRLTLKQLLWFGFGGFILFVIWSLFQKWVFWVSLPFVVVLSAAFAFWKPAGLTLINFLIMGFRHLINPKQMVWQKENEKPDNENKYPKRPIDTSKEENLRIVKKKTQQLDDLEHLAKILDEKSDL